MMVLALVFQILMTRSSGAAPFLRSAATRRPRCSPASPSGRVKTSVYLLSGVLAGVSGVVLVARPGAGQGGSGDRLRAGHHRVGRRRRRQPAGGRGSVVGAVLGTLIFGVLRNALPQIPGATFYDR